LRPPQVLGSSLHQEQSRNGRKDAAGRRNREVSAPDAVAFPPASGTPSPLKHRAVHARSGWKAGAESESVAPAARRAAEDATGSARPSRVARTSEENADSQRNDVERSGWSAVKRGHPPGRASHLTVLARDADPGCSSLTIGLHALIPRIECARPFRGHAPRNRLGCALLDEARGDAAFDGASGAPRLYTGRARRKVAHANQELTGQALRIATPSL
jgi:hypothetical protein